MWRRLRTLAEILANRPYNLAGRSFAKRYTDPHVLPGDQAPLTPLERYFNGITDGPGIWKWRHYFPVYHQHFARFVGQEVHVVEIGIYSGGSLPMWHHYFGPQCHVYGVDIEPACRAYNSDRTRVFIGDQADPSFWADFRRQVPRVDIVIDDGGHAPRQQRITIEALLPHLRPGGVYLCEDIHGRVNPFTSYIAGLTAYLHQSVAVSREQQRGQPNALQAHLAGIYSYPYVTVIEKRSASLPTLDSVRRGTQWQPFL